MATKDILKTYYDPKSSGSFGGVNRLHKLHPKVTHKRVLQALQTSSTYTKHKSSKHSYARRKVNVHTANYLWQADLVVLLKLAKYNKNNQYILTCIDVFSKKAYAAAIKRKTGQQVTDAFNHILAAAGAKPKYLQTDLGLEFENSIFKKSLTDNNISMFSVHSDKKACIVERFNRTLMMRLQKYFDYQKKFKYIDVLQDIVESYNNSVHRTTGIAPNNVNKHNEMDVWLKTNKDLYTRKWSGPKDISEGDYVRIKQPKKTFQKGYDPSFSSNIYKVSKVLFTKPVTFKLLDQDGDSLLGIFYQDEISKVII